MIQLIFQMHLLICLTIAKRNNVLRFFQVLQSDLPFSISCRCLGLISIAVRSQFALEKMFILLESGKLHNNSQIISKANLVTFRDFLGSVTIYHSVDAIVFKVITVFLLKALGVHIVKWKWTEVAFVRFCVVRSYGDFKEHHLVLLYAKNPKVFL